MAEERPQALEGARRLEHLLRMPVWACTTSPPPPRRGCCPAAAARCLWQAVRAAMIDRLAAVTHGACPSYTGGPAPPRSLRKRLLSRYAAGIAWISPKLPSSWAHHLRKHMQNQLKTQCHFFSASSSGFANPLIVPYGVQHVSCGVRTGSSGLVRLPEHWGLLSHAALSRRSCGSRVITVTTAFDVSSVRLQ